MTLKKQLGHTKRARAKKQKEPMTFEQAKSMYVHRFTMEHVPAWSRVIGPEQKYYAPQFATDAEWFANTKFPPDPICYNGDCYTSGQTWPLGQWLDSPYVATQKTRIKYIVSFGTSKHSFYTDYHKEQFTRALDLNRTPYTVEEC